MLRPIRRWISCVRPPSCALSRVVRVRVARGSIAYSAVSHPSPLPRFQPGTPSSTDAVHNTRVAPNVMRQDPSAYGATPRSKVIGRSSDASRSLRSVLPCFTQFPYDGGGGLSWRERNDDNLTSPAFHFVCADYRLFGVIAALHNHVRPENPYQLEWSVLPKDNNEVDALDRSDNEGAFRLAPHWPARPLEPANRIITIDSDDQPIGASAG